METYTVTAIVVLSVEFTATVVDAIEVVGSLT
jgi:hypothetical protein